MAAEWSATLEMNAQKAGALIQYQFGLVVESIELLGRGWDNYAYLVNNQLVFRFPCRQMGIDCMHNEIALLPYIAQHVTFPFSCPEWIGQPSADYDAPFAGYRLLRGTLLSDTPAVLIDNAECAKTLALWLRQLQAIPVKQEHRTMLKGDQTWRYNVLAMLEKNRQRIVQYAHHFKDAGFMPDILFQQLDTFATLAYEPLPSTSYIHGDLYSRHLLVDSANQLSGIIDWGDVHIGNPAYDLTVVYQLFTPRAADIFLKHYGSISQEINNFALMRAFCHAIALLSYCYEQKEENLKQWTILTLHRVLNSFS